ncbi:MAG: hypothetical protein P8L66_12725 [Rhodospirillaceae bacterium]|nr:hypothetical protein [Rhodospirillaceae bacterium]
MQRQINSSLIVVAVMAVMILASSVRAADTDCARAADVEAFVTRDLRSQLMVAGLVCAFMWWRDRTPTLTKR